MLENFYPTPASLIEKMLDKIDIKEFNSILEPSCGKGDILDIINYKKGYGAKVYGIEIEHYLREISKSKCEIIGYDFLQFNNKAVSFDLIIANFPFSDGDKHFLKAWDILDKGEMVCILNAETLKNPYSQTRKLIMKIIEDNGGTIDYLQGEFEEAERETKVEVVLVHIKKDKGHFDSIFSDFQKDFLNDYAEIGESNEMIKQGDQIEDIIKINNLLKKEIVKKFIALKKEEYYYNMFKNAIEDKFFTKIKFNRDDLKNEIFEVNRRCWQFFFDKSSIRTKVTGKVYEDFIKEYQNSQLDFTYDNIQRVQDIILCSLDKITEENITGVFDYLTKYHEDNREHIEGWKTNSGYKLAKRFILPYVCEYESRRSNPSPRFHSRAIYNLDDIDKVFCNLSGKRFEDIQQTRDYDKNKECEFFEVKMYKKGTAHFLVKDKYLDTLKDFNYQVCKYKKWLPQ